DIHRPAVGRQDRPRRRGHPRCRPGHRGRPRRGRRDRVRRRPPPAVSPVTASACGRCAPRSWTACRWRLRSRGPTDLPDLHRRHQWMASRQSIDRAYGFREYPYTIAISPVTISTREVRSLAQVNTEIKPFTATAYHNGSFVEV